MAKSLFEEMGGRYERQGDYLIIGGSNSPMLAS